MNNPLRIGIVGAGRIVRAEHVPRFRAIPGVELTAVANRTPASSLAAGAELGIPRVFDDWRQLVADPDVDAVLIGAWPVLHAPVTIAALEGGKHVLTEARMAATAEDGRRMLATARRYPERVAMIVPASFSLWADATIRRQLADGAIGAVRHVRALWDASGPADPGDAWRWRRRDSGENVMALGILYEAMARWLGRANAVTAVTRYGTKPRLGPDGPFMADIPEHVLAILEFDGGLTATVEMSARTTPRDANSITFFGTDGVLRLDLAAGQLAIVPHGGDPAPIEIAADDRAEWTAEIDFVAAIRGERPVTLTDFETGVHYMSVLEAIDRAARSGRRERVRADDPGADPR